MLINMKAMIFAAGVGSRLGELTHSKPKCLMEAGGKTLLEHVITKLTATGVTEIVINVHHHADQVTRYLSERGNFGITIHTSHEPELLDTGGGLKKVRDVFAAEDAFIVHNADVHCTHDLRALVAEHTARKAVATLCVMQRSSSRGLFFDSTMRLTGWSKTESTPPPSSSMFAFSGISVCSGELFSFMDSRDTFSIIEPFVVASKTTRRVFGVEIDASDWIDIGTPEKLKELQQRYSTT
jgi:NDP-sugar pyrophosphorylase family protein